MYLDAGAGDDARHGGNPNLDPQTNFYTCASCNGADPGSGAMLVLGVAFVLRRRRR